MSDETMALRKAITEAPATVVPGVVNIKTVGKLDFGPEIRQFDTAAINDQIERAVSILKDTERIAAVGYLDDEGAHVALVHRLDKLPFTDVKIPGDFRWTVMHTERWRKGRKTAAGFRWSM